MVKPIEIPPLPQTWSRYDATTSRLTNGLLVPEPNYVFCCIGTNDHTVDQGIVTHLDITFAYREWLGAVRAACPTSAIFCVSPPLGWHAAEIAEAVSARAAVGDRRVCFINTSALQDGFSADSPSTLAQDGVHPSVYGNALLAALISGEVRR
jgi:lysophospholipase L1-like esterase